jgi:hypothetical protein
VTLSFSESIIISLSSYHDSALLEARMTDWGWKQWGDRRHPAPYFELLVAQAPDVGRQEVNLILPEELAERRHPVLKAIEHVADNLRFR